MRSRTGGRAMTASASGGHTRLQVAFIPSGSFRPLLHLSVGRFPPGEVKCLFALFGKNLCGGGQWSNDFRQVLTKDHLMSLLGRYGDYEKIRHGPCALCRNPYFPSQGTEVPAPIGSPLISRSLRNLFACLFGDSNRRYRKRRIPEG